MHTYSTDNDSRPKVYAVLALLSYYLMIGLGYLTNVLTQSLALSVAIGVPSWGVFFTVSFAIFNRRLWNTPVARTLGATQVPYLDGDWEGWIKTSYDGHIPDDALHPEDDPDADWRTLKATLHIDQTWREISVHFATETSYSDSGGATLLTEEGKWPSINYQYQNDPPPDAVEGMVMHHGTADLELKEFDDEEILEGVYYTGPHRENHGRMWFKRVN